MKAPSTVTVITLGLTIMLAVIAVNALAAQNNPADSATGRWEHLALTQDSARVGSDREVTRQIVKLGEEGWELVTVSTTIEEGTTLKTVFYFKRRK